MDNDGVEQVTQITQQDRKDSGENYLYIVLFYFLGTVSFIPHNIYITANEYWMYKFRDTNLQFNKSDTAEKTTLQQNFTSFAGLAGYIGLFLFIFLTAWIRRIIAIQTRIIGCMILLLVFFVVTVVFIFVDTDPWQAEFFAVALLIGGLLNASSGVLLVSLFELTSQFHPRCLAALFAGQSVCGILAALIQIVALLAASRVKITAALYYFVTIVMIASIMIAYMLVCIKSSDFQARMKRFQKKNEKSEKKQTKFELGKMKRVLKKLTLRLTAISLIQLTTNVLHPGFTSLIESSGKGTNVWSDTYFIPVCVFLIFYTSEFIAREGSNYFMVLKNIYIILGTSIAQAALIPLILLCNIQPRNVLPVIFHDDAYFIVFVILLGVSAGYVVNIVILIHGDNFNPEEEVISKIIIVLSVIIVKSIASIMNGILVNLI